MWTWTWVRACAIGLATVAFAGANATAQEDPAAEADPFAAAAAAADEGVERVDRYAAVAALASPSPIVRERGAAQLLATRDRAWIPPLVDQLFFVPKGQRGEILRVLAALAGERHERYLDWVEYVGNHPELAAPPGYLGWKGALFSRIDPRFRELLRDGAPLRIRAEEIVSGGVPFDGIPSLEQPAHVPAAAAKLADDEPVFAAEVGGEAHAWPLGVLSWHEMLNDSLGGEPVTLSFCTLCRSAVLYRGRLPSGDETTFGTSGLLYRSNKLMFDRRTLTLWSNLTGEAVLGPLAAGEPQPGAPAAGAQPPALEMLPLVLTTWGAWRTLHPQTTVMLGDSSVARRYGYDYRPGAADARRAGVSFPVPRADTRLPPKDEVWGLRLGGRAKAYALQPLLAAGLVNDAIGDEPVVLIADAESGAVRAYRRGPHRFRAGDNGELVDEQGIRWRLDEGFVTAIAGGADPLPRLSGVPSFWFGWQAFYPGSELWIGNR